MDQEQQKQERPHILIRGEVTNHPEKRHAGKTGIVADLHVVAKEIVIDGVALSPQEVEAQKWQKVPVWGGKAETAGDRYRAGTEVTIEGRSGIREWKTSSGQKRLDRIVYDAQVQVDKESTRGHKVVLEGRVGRSPVLEQTPNGRAFTRMKLDGVEATSSNGPEVPDRVSVLGWEQQARDMENTFREGDLLRVVGELKATPYERNGEKRTFWEVQRPEIELLQKARDRGIDSDRAEPGYQSRPDGRYENRGTQKPTLNEPKPGILDRFLSKLGGGKSQETERSR